MDCGQFILFSGEIVDNYLPFSDAILLFIALSSFLVFWCLRAKLGTEIVMFVGFL